jgi:hypothetical protein
VTIVRTENWNKHRQRLVMHSRACILVWSMGTRCLSERSTHPTYHPYVGRRRSPVCRVAVRKSHPIPARRSGAEANHPAGPARCTVLLPVPYSTSGDRPGHGGTENRKSRAISGVPRDEHHHHAKLTKCHVREIRASRESLDIFAHHYGMGKTTIWLIRAGESWRDAGLWCRRDAILSHGGLPCR